MQQANTAQGYTSHEYQSTAQQQCSTRSAQQQCRAAQVPQARHGAPLRQYERATTHPRAPPAAGWSAWRACRACRRAPHTWPPPAGSAATHSRSCALQQEGGTSRAARLTDLGAAPGRAGTAAATAARPGTAGITSSRNHASDAAWSQAVGGAAAAAGCTVQALPAARRRTSIDLLKLRKLRLHAGR